MNVVELIKEKLEEVRKYECGMLNGYCQSTITKAISIVDEVAQEYNNGWIPCSERLPDTKENKNYLVCGNKGGIYIAEFVCKNINGKDIGPWWSARGRYCPNPIAWMPLPEPYKEGGSDVK